MIIDDGQETGKHREMVTLEKESGDFKMVDILMQKETYKVARKVRSDTANIAADTKHKLWHERVGYCGSETMPKALPFIRGLIFQELEKNAKPCRLFIFRKRI